MAKKEMYRSVKAEPEIVAEAESEITAEVEWNEEAEWDEEAEKAEEEAKAELYSARKMRGRRRQRSLRKNTQKIRLGKGFLGQRALKAKEKLAKISQEDDIELQKEVEEKLASDWKRGKNSAKLAKHYDKYSAKKRRFFK